MLRELQRAFSEALYAQGPESPSVAAAAENLDSMPRLDARASLAIYQNAVGQCMTESLGEIFPVCAELVAEDCFRTVANLYYREIPSAHADLARVGDAFPEFVAGLDFLSGLPYLADMARLELGFHNAYSASWPPPPHAPGVLGQAIADEPENWRFLLSPSATLLASAHPVLTLWEAHQDRRIDGGWTLDPRAAGERTLVFRQGAEIHADLVEPSLWPILLSISEGEPVAEQLELAGALRRSEGQTPDSGINPGENVPILTTIQMLFERGWVVGGEPI
ncbi:MAG: DNA-binding domain-containing protein [Myxococcota bacterium]|jgi:hypothetical protein|nr:DNA-binding domain-containing protein [Myxococcota bacterium]